MKINHSHIIGIVTVVVSLSFAFPTLAEVTTETEVNADTEIRVGNNVRPILNKIEKMASTTRPIMGIGVNTRLATSGRDRSENRTENRIENKKEHGDKMIDQRIDSLNKLMSRINDMKRISDTDKASLEAIIKLEIADLTNLKVKMSASTSTISLKEDIASITKAERVYALVQPQIVILAGANRVLAIADSMTIVANKISARLASSTQASTTAAAQVALADMKVQIENAVTNAKSAIAQVTNLKADNGDTSIAASNKAALQSARANIVSAQKALKLAQKDARSIIEMLTVKNRNK